MIFNPQKVEELKERYPLALQDLYIQLDVKNGLRVRPDTQPECVFDFFDRVRLIISREKEPSGRMVIHIAGSVFDIGECQIIPLNDTLVHHIVEHYALISGNNGGLEVIGISNEKIIHLVYRLDN